MSDSTEKIEPCYGKYCIVRGLQVPLKVYLLEVTDGTDTTCRS